MLDSALRSNAHLSVRATQGKGVMPDGTTRFKCRGKDIYHFVRVMQRCSTKYSKKNPFLIQMGTSTFSQYTVVADISVVAVQPSAPLSRVCLLGCGITTAWGAVVKQPGIKGSNVAVFGCGAIGLGVIETSRLVGASRIIAVDTNPGKESWAKKFGATDFINPSMSMFLL